MSLGRLAAPGVLTLEYSSVLSTPGNTKILKSHSWWTIWTDADLKNADHTTETTPLT
jgi:hypothetical protein